VIKAELYGGANDNLVEISLAKLRDATPLTGATVTVTVADHVTGQAVTGASLPITMQEVDQHYITSEEDGSQVLAQRYRGTLPSQLNLVYGRLYDITILVVHAGGYDGECIITRPAKKRILT
jgi:hypothetical protein